jgi:hypothetical protein
MLKIAGLAVVVSAWPSSGPGRRMSLMGRCGRDLDGH